MDRERIPLIGSFLSRETGHDDDIPVNPGRILEVNAISNAGINEEDENPPEGPVVDRKALIERWKKLPDKVDSYPGGPYYPAGKRLIIGGEQVMDTFERPWCNATVASMFDGLDDRGPLTVVERGFGLGIMSEYILNRMRSIGGRYIIIELNAGVAKYARDWAKGRRSEIPRMLFPPELKIDIIEGDADEKLSEFPDNSIDLLFSDTHQLKPDEIGINDILQPDLIAKKLTPEGRFTFCAFHRNNQTGIVEDRQRELLGIGFKEWKTSHVEVVPPPDCEYLQGPRRILPVIVAYNPKKGNGESPNGS